MAVSSEVWQLFVDESGDFAAGDPVVAGGWLVRWPDSPALRAYLRRTLDESLATAPRPQHAASCNLLATRVAHYALEARAGRLRGGADGTPLGAALEAMERSQASAELLGFSAAVTAGRFPEYAALKAASAWLWAREPRLAQRLEDLAHAEAQTLFASLGQIPSDEAFLLVAHEDELEDVEAKYQDRYLALLEVVFERALALFREEKASVTIRAHVLTRHVQVPNLPRPLPLRAADVGAAVRRAEAFPLRAPPNGETDKRVRIVPETPSVWAPTMHPGLIVADWICNRGLHVFKSARHARLPWDATRARLEERVSLAPLARLRAAPSTPLVPSVAVQGAPRVAIAEAFATGRGPMTAQECPVRWQTDQANAWIANAGGVR